MKIATRSRWVAGAAVCVLAGLGLVVGTAVRVVDRRSETVPNSLAQAEFAQIRNQFAGQPALLDMTTRQVGWDRRCYLGSVFLIRMPEVGWQC